MSAAVLAFEKETIRHLAGPELFMQTGLEPMGPGAIEDVNGGGWVGAIISGVSGGIVGGALSAEGSLASAAISFTLSAAISGVASYAIGG